MLSTEFDALPFLVRLFDPRSGIGAGALDFFELEMIFTKVHEESYEKPDLTEEMIEKWWCVGDERNREAVWVQGVKIFG